MHDGTRAPLNVLVDSKVPAVPELTPAAYLAARAARQNRSIGS